VQDGDQNSVKDTIMRVLVSSEKRGGGMGKPPCILSGFLILQEGNDDGNKAKGGGEG